MRTIFSAILLVIFGLEVAVKIDVLPQSYITPTSFVIDGAHNLFNKYSISKNDLPKQELKSNIADNTQRDSYLKNTGTAFYYRSDGLMLTNAHVVKECDEIQVSNEAGAFRASVLKLSSSSDLALLKIIGNGIPKHKKIFFDLKEPIPGEKVIVFGFPLGKSIATNGSFSEGIVNSDKVKDDPAAFQISAQIHQGNSGSAVVNKNGQLVGIASSQVNPVAFFNGTGTLPQNINFAIKASQVENFLKNEIQIETKSFFDFLYKFNLPDESETQAKLQQITAEVSCFAKKSNSINPSQKTWKRKRTSIELTGIDSSSTGLLRYFYVRNKGQETIVEIKIGYVFEKKEDEKCKDDVSYYNGVALVRHPIEPGITEKIISTDIPIDAKYFCAINYEYGPFYID